jgi:hypothetical protein
MTTSNKGGAPPGNTNALNHGAPPGNNNAYKHGFYSHTFTHPEKRRLDRGLLGEFNDEEALLHVLIARTAVSMKNLEMTHEGSVVALRAVSLAIGRIESLHRSRKVIYDNQTTLDKALDELKYIPVEED